MQSGSVSGPVSPAEGAAEEVCPGPVGNDWGRHYARGLAWTDLLVTVWAVVGVQLVWLDDLSVSLPLPELGSVNYFFVSAFIVAGWMVALKVSGSRNSRVFGQGAQEYQAVLNASFVWFGLVAIAAVLVKADIARGYLLMAFPAGTALLWASRWLWRQWLTVERKNSGAMSARVLVAGTGRGVSRIIEELRRVPEAGYQVVGVCLPEGQHLNENVDSDGLVFGSLDDVVGTMRRAGGDTVVVTGTEKLPPSKVRRISWELQSGSEHLAVVPNLVDIAGPRIKTRPVAGLPLMHVETPRFTGPAKLIKRMFDIVCSACAVVVLSPLLVALAIIVKVTSSGPVLFKQQRIGTDSKPLTMLKFRSMRVGAEKELKALLEKQGTSEKPLFKVNNDPRITPIGRVLRQYSLDELPQFFNVLAGSMSLVGPRPQIAAEVALYDDAASRRLLVKPGITGLWQVSGRSDLTWDESVRLDLFYVENWSLMGDLQILWKTLKVVFAHEGAY